MAEVFSVQDTLVHMMGYLKLQVFSEAAAVYRKGTFLFHPVGSTIGLESKGCWLTLVFYCKHEV